MREHIYAAEPEASLFIGKPTEGHISNYYPSKLIINDEEVAAVQAASEKLSIDILNTRYEANLLSGHPVFSLVSRVVKNGPDDCTLLIASADKKDDVEHSVDVNGKTIKLTVRHGDYSADLTKVVEALKEARKYAANDNQANMIGSYIES